MPLEQECEEGIFVWARENDRGSKFQFNQGTVDLVGLNASGL